MMQKKTYKPKDKNVRKLRIMYNKIKKDERKKNNEDCNRSTQKKKGL